jgi:hypothetical protein
MTLSPQSHPQPQESKSSCSRSTAGNSTDSKFSESSPNVVEITRILPLEQSIQLSAVLKRKDLSAEDGETKILEIEPEHADAITNSLNLDSQPSKRLFLIISDSSTGENLSQCLPRRNPPRNHNSLITHLFSKPIGYIFLRETARAWLSDNADLKRELLVQGEPWWRIHLIEIGWALNLVWGSIKSK